MILEIHKNDRFFTGSIKIGRHKTFKAMDQESSSLLFTKIMAFKKDQDYTWVQTELVKRTETLRRMYNISTCFHNDKRILQARIKQTKQEKVLYLSNMFMQGWNLSDFISKKDQLGFLKTYCIKDKIWQLLNIMVVSQGFGNLIITHQNLFLKAVSQDTYELVVNHLSFVGQAFLRGEAIQRQQYAEIAMFLDEQSLQTGNIDRYQFHLRNFACLVVFLLIERNPFKFIFQGVQIDHYITRDKARKLHRQVVTPRLNKLLSFGSLAKKIEETDIKDLGLIINTAFNNPKESLDWASIHKRMVQGQDSYQESPFTLLSQQLWKSQSQFKQKILIDKGFGIENGPRLYLIMKLGVNMQLLLKTNKWQKMLRNQQFNRLNLEMFKRFLRFFKLKSQTVSNLLASTLPAQFKQILTVNHQLDNRKNIRLPSTYRDILSQYPGNPC